MERLPRAELSKVYGRSLIWLTAALAFAVFPGKNALWGEEGFFAEVVRELPWAGAIMYRRTWRGLVTVREYRPNNALHVQPGREAGGL